MQKKSVDYEIYRYRLQRYKFRYLEVYVHKFGKESQHS